MDTTLTTPTTTTTDRRPGGVDTTPDGHHWEQAGEAWGSRAPDWACLFEHYAIDVITAAFLELGVGRTTADGTSLLDIACGSGLAVRMADGLGVRTAGIDAAAPLIEIARRRTPDADLRVGTMFELPWDDDTFDDVISINGIWGGCEAALAEAHRVLRPGGGIAISFWGSGHLDLAPCFRVFARQAPRDHAEGMKETNAIGQPGVAEDMLVRAGFEIVGRRSRVSTIEWPDAETAWRALASAGPAVPALENVGADVLRPLVLDAIEDRRDAQGIYRLRNDQQFVIARKPV